MAVIEVLLLAFFLIFLVLIIMHMDSKYRRSEEDNVVKRLFGKRGDKADG